MTEDQRERLSKLLGMLGSDMMGERAVAAKKVAEAANEYGGWDALLAPAASGDPTVAAFKEFNPEAFAEAVAKAVTTYSPLPRPAELLRDNGARLSAWEAKFLSEMAAIELSGRSLHGGQITKLNEIRRDMANPPKRGNFGKYR